MKQVKVKVNGYDIVIHEYEEQPYRVGAWTIDDWDGELEPFQTWDHYPDDSEISWALQEHLGVPWKDRIEV